MSTTEQSAEADSQRVQLSSPPGYGRVVPFDKATHAGLGVRPDYSFDWCRSINAVFVNAVEFARAATDYPLAFTRNQDTGEYLPVAILGLRKDENLFVDQAGKWRPMTYVPAYFRRHPFCIAELPTDDGETRRLVCVDESHLAPSDEPMFEADGNATDAWTRTQQLLEAVESAREQTSALCKRLDALELLTGFDALATSRAGQQMRLQGMFRVDEEKLAQLEGKQLKQLLDKGHLRCIHAHLISLENFARLLDLTASTDGD